MGQHFKCIAEDVFCVKKYSTRWYLKDKYEMYVGLELMLGLCSLSSV